VDRLADDLGRAPTDEELVRTAQDGNPVGLGMLLERHRAGMQAVALSLLGYSPEAQDAVQDAMLIALQRLGELRDPAAAGPWLRAIVRNACRMRLRAAQTDLAGDPDLLLVPSDAPTPEEALDRHALRDWVWQALQELSEPLQVVLLLRYFSGITAYEQIAALCGVPIGIVRSRLHQARQKLGAALLVTAGAAHDDAATLLARRRRDVAQLFTAAERGQFGAALAASWSPELALVGPQGQRGRGVQTMIQIMESDLDAGVRQWPVDVTASQRFTVIEADLLSPPWDPEHCPPRVVWLLTLRDGQVEQVRLFHFHPALASPDLPLGYVWVVMFAARGASPLSSLYLPMTFLTLFCRFFAEQRTFAWTCASR
jgi:RNA polymerase sigma-70 factor (ECF subfamily)